MNAGKLLARRALKDDSGQVFIWGAFTMVMMLGMGGLTLDLGRAYLFSRMLQASTDAAALAGAEALPNSPAVSQAIAYSAVAGNKNSLANLPNVTMVSGYPLLKCLTTLLNEGEACITPQNANAIQVKQTVSVQTYFIRVLSVFGVKSASSFTLTASATASMRGASAVPYNVLILLDSTSSMTTADTDCGTNITRFQCALNGVKILLEELDPCAALYATCSVTNGVATNSVDRVNIMTFPNLTVGTAADEYGCDSSSISIPVYSFPTIGASTYAPTGSTTATYQVTGFLSDYRTSDTADALATASDLSIAVGAGKNGTSCEMDAKGGDGTYYAGAIYAAQAALTAEQSANPGSLNVMIILSDGEANASASKMATKAVNGATVSTSSGIYPSTIDQCQQAITAAEYAAGLGTRVYSVAYGSENSGCSTTTGGTDTNQNLSPCITMEQMASAPQYFFSDYNQSGSASTCQSVSQPTTSISQIFWDIGADFTVPRLIPDGTT